MSGRTAPPVAFAVPFPEDAQRAFFERVQEVPALEPDAA